MNLSKAKSDLQQARELLAEGHFKQGLDYLRSAAGAGLPDAIIELGWRLASSSAEPEHQTEGISILQDAETKGLAAAGYYLAIIALGDVRLDCNFQSISERLQRSAQAGYPPALRDLAVFWGQSESPELLRLSTQCLEHAAVGGDILSLALLERRLRRGIGCALNERRADAIAGLFQGSGIPVAPPKHPVPAHEAEAANLSPLEELPLPDLNQRYVPSEPVLSCDGPYLRQYANVLSEEECDLIRLIAAPNLAPSITADPDGRMVRVQLRTSEEYYMFTQDEDISLRLIQRRMLAHADLPLRNSENPTVLRYLTGQEYRLHRDHLPPSVISSDDQPGAGQRAATVIAYLNDVAGPGGGTIFPQADVTVRPAKGSVLVFKNLLPNGEPDMRTLHAGEPVSSGEKWIMTLWVRQGALRRI